MDGEPPPRRPEESSSPEHQLEGDERLYTGEPVETESGLRRPQQMNVGVDNMEGGGEWPDPDTPPSPGASGWDRDHAFGTPPAGDEATADARISVDHDEIRRWVEDHGGAPVRARPAGEGGGAGVPQIDFLGGRSDRSLEPVAWDEWFRMFDDDGLALLVRDGDEKRGDRAFVEFVRR